jgi:hypothetical protein
MAEHLVPIATFSRQIDAELAKSKLEAEGVRCFIANGHTDRINFDWCLTGATSQIKLMVRKADQELAQAILAEDPEEARLALEQVFDESPEDRCPRCGSLEIRKQGVSAFRASIALMLVALLVGRPVILLLIGFPILFSWGRRRCADCGHRWKER